MPEKNEAICVSCGHRWKSKWNANNVPERAQCPNCWGYSFVLLAQYRGHIKKLGKRFSPEEVKKFKEFYSFAVKHGYVRNPSSRETKFQRLLQDLANPESSLGAET